MSLTLEFSILRHTKNADTSVSEGTDSLHYREQVLGHIPPLCPSFLVFLYGSHLKSIGLKDIVSAKPREKQHISFPGKEEAGEARAFPFLGARLGLFSQAFPGLSSESPQAPANLFY